MKKKQNNKLIEKGDVLVAKSEYNPTEKAFYDLYFNKSKDTFFEVRDTKRNHYLTQPILIIKTNCNKCGNLMETEFPSESISLLKYSLKNPFCACGNKKDFMILEIKLK